ncbi:MAG: hypothetical protein ACXVBZ_11130, partial [Flavisolibacter sp.]
EIVENVLIVFNLFLVECFLKEAACSPEGGLGGRVLFILLVPLKGRLIFYNSSFMTGLQRCNEKHCLLLI